MSKPIKVTRAKKATSNSTQKQRAVATQKKPSSGQQAGGKAKLRAVRDTSKLGAVVTLLRRKEGATIDQLVKATGWQAHSVRGAISGAIKKKLGLAIASTKTDGVRTYRVTG